MSQKEPPIIYTVGHGAADFPTVSDLLARHAIATIIDVRSRPYSRHATDFNKDTLSDLAQAAGFGYRWMGDTLGGLDGTPEAASFLAALHQVSALARTAPVVLLCAEGDPSRCHRSTVLAPALEEMGARVVHVLPDGSTRVHQPSFDW